MTTNKRGTNVPPEDKQLEMLEYLAIHNLTAHPSALTIKQGKAIDTWELKTPMMVNGKLSGLHKLMYTMSILHDVDYQQTMAPYSERYCFEDEWRALSELIEWHKRGFDDQPPIGW
ncbi:hypothetical protein, partial [Photobacterium halotolerans]|uniref:hypothetical protein n=1 Tax=Photobacterium halotolerans TaxID=265726 RepID=UPI00056AAB81